MRNIFLNSMWIVWKRWICPFIRNAVHSVTRMNFKNTVYWLHMSEQRNKLYYLVKEILHCFVDYLKYLLSLCKFKTFRCKGRNNRTPICIVSIWYCIIKIHMCAFWKYLCMGIFNHSCYLFQNIKLSECEND